MSPETRISMDTRLVPKPSVVLREEDDNYALLYDPESGSVRILNSTAAAIWNLIDGRRTVGEVMALLREAFEGLDASAETQLLRLIQGLYQVGALGLPEDPPR
jgi:hypothetical protein